MKREIEIKFMIREDKIGFIQKKLKEQGGEFIGKVFEKTLRFDTPNKDLEARGLFLRIKTGFSNLITLKEKISDKNFKEREEIEFEISNPQKMKIILEKLGFTNIRIMEKYREKWRIKNTEIVIDILPMGIFLEIEGDKKSIKEMVKVLKLKFKNRITNTYWELWEEFSKRKRIESKDIIFNFKKKRR